jgi:hypothetical protein
MLEIRREKVVGTPAPDEHNRCETKTLRAAKMQIIRGIINQTREFLLDRSRNGRVQ